MRGPMVEMIVQRVGDDVIGWFREEIRIWSRMNFLIGGHGASLNNNLARQVGGWEGGDGRLETEDWRLERGVQTD